MKKIILLLLMCNVAVCQDLTSQNLTSKDSTKVQAPVNMKVLTPEVHMRNMLTFQEKQAGLVGVSSMALIGYAFLSHFHGNQPPVLLGSAVVLGGFGVIQSISLSNEIKRYREKHFPRKKKLAKN